MLRIHFTPQDLARTRVDPPDPLWETVLSLHRLRATGGEGVVFAAWRERAQREIGHRPILPQLRLLCSLVPVRGYFPDFLTPAGSPSTLDDGLELLRRTPHARLRADLAHSARERLLPSWTGSLADGDRETLDLLADAVRDVHDVLVAPGWTDLSRDTRTDRGQRTEVLDAEGTETLLATLDWATDWDGRTLTAPYPYDLELHLDGRGLRLVPSFFCRERPVTLADPSLTPMLVYPIRHRTTWRLPAASHRHQRAVEDLLGRTRARVLVATTRGPLSTTDIARRVGVAPSSASEHLGLLRAAGLVYSRRAANTVLHEVTSVGCAVLGGTHQSSA